MTATHNPCGQGCVSLVVLVDLEKLSENFTGHVLRKRNVRTPAQKHSKNSKNTNSADGNCYLKDICHDARSYIQRMTTAICSMFAIAGHF